MSLNHSSHVNTGHEMDIRDLKFEADSFDVAIDKGAFVRLTIARSRN